MRLPLRKRRSRFARAADTLRRMRPRHQPSRLARVRASLSEAWPALRPGRARADQDDLLLQHATDLEENREAFSSLHWMTAGLFLAAGAETTFGARRGDYRDPDALRWAPLVAAPLAGAAHAARALWPSDTTRRISQILNGVAVGVGTAGVANSLYQAVRDRTDEYGEPLSASRRVPSLAPLAFAAVGLLGFLLNDQEEREVEERAELRRLRAERQARRRDNRIRRVVLKV